MNPPPTCPVTATTEASPPINRRAFLRTALVAGLGTLTAEWWASTRAPAASHVEPFPIPGAADLPPGGALSFTIPGTEKRGVLVRLAAKRYAAFDRRCPHLGCPVLWSAERGQFECPCHRGVFDGTNGRVVAGPPPRELQRIEVEQRGTEVWARGITTANNRKRSEV